MSKEEYIKSPLNYVGGKYKLLKEIIPLFPKDIHTFIDVFGGGFNVGINVQAKHIIYNDVCFQVVNLFENLYKSNFTIMNKAILDIVEEYNLSNSDLKGYAYYNCNSNDGLSNYNKDKYIQLRKSYNTSQDWLLFYVLILYAFSNQIRFNLKNEFNMPCGKRDYNASIKSKLNIFLNKLNNLDISFINKSFDKLDFSKFSSYDLVYCDPPYLNSVASYNEQKGWTDKEEQDLLDLLDSLNKRGIPFALSNNLKYNNSILEKWKAKYKVHYLNGDYSNCNYHKIDRSKDIEILITNY